jgi:uncharacterized protein (TIGR02594 family)
MCGTLSLNPNAAPRDGSTRADATARCCPPPPWMPLALGELGVHENPGLSNANPRVMGYHSASDFWGADDSTAENAWCASFVTWSLSQAGITPATNGFRAESYSKTQLDIDGNGWPSGIVIPRPVYGATARKRRNGGGHVGFVVGTVPDQPDRIAILGGNQGGAKGTAAEGGEVNVASYPRYDEAGGELFVFMVPMDYPWECCVLQDYTGAIGPVRSEE